MNEVAISDQGITDDLFPFTLTRSVADIRVGILTLREKWRAYLNVEPVFSETGIAANTIAGLNAAIKKPWDIFLLNDRCLREDYKVLTAGRQSVAIPPTVQAIQPDQIFIEEDARLSHCIINASTGPVYIGKNTEIMEGCIIRGPFALGEGSVIKMGAKIYGATTIGPYCVAGGEIKNAVIFGYSNKAHDGYLGDSVIGEWCNLGAGSSNSNVQNNAGEVKVWNFKHNEFESTGLNKCGLLMGDYSRAAINTSFNTGTVVGACANIFGGSLMPKYIPSFSWGDGSKLYEFDKALQHIANWKKLKGQELGEQEKSRLKLIFEQNK